MVPSRVSQATRAAAATSSSTMPVTRMRSWRARGRRPISGRPPEARAVPSPAAPREPKGSLNVIAMGGLLSQELAVAGDDGQVDELRPGVVGRRIADEEAADVDVLH